MDFLLTRHRRSSDVRHNRVSSPLRSAAKPPAKPRKHSTRHTEKPSSSRHHHYERSRSHRSSFSSSSSTTTSPKHHRQHSTASSSSSSSPAIHPFRSTSKRAHSEPQRRMSTSDIRPRSRKMSALSAMRMLSEASSSSAKRPLPFRPVRDRMRAERQTTEAWPGPTPVLSRNGGKGRGVRGQPRPIQGNDVADSVMMMRIRK